MSYRIDPLPDTHGRKNWKITFPDSPTFKQIQAIVEEYYPHEGYGPSIISIPRLIDGEYCVFVSSNHSCD